MIWHSRQVALRDAHIVTRNLARSLAEHAARAIQSTDSILAAVAERAENDGYGPDDLSKLQRLLIIEQRTARQIRSLAVIDEHGTWIVDSRSADSPAPNTADRDYFRYHHEHAGAALYMEGPLRSRAVGDWVITLTRRFNHPDGSFAGVVLASLQAGYFERFYKTLNIGPNSLIGLFTADNEALVQYPPIPKKIEAIHGLSFADQAVDNKDTGDPLGEKNSHAGRVVSTARLDEYPLITSVSRAENEVLAEWRNNSLTQALAVFLVTFAIGVLGSRLTAQVRRGTVAEARTAQTLEELRESERRYRLLAQHSTDVIIQTDIYGVRHYVSPAVEDIIGWRASDLIGPNQLVLTHPDDMSAMTEMIARLRHDLTDRSVIDVRIRHRDGHYIWCELMFRVLRDGKGPPISLVGTGRDITQRKRIEDELSRKNTLLNAILMNMPDGVELIDESLQLLAHNDQLFQLFDLDRDTVLASGEPGKMFYNALARRSDYGAVTIDELLATRRSMVLDRKPVQLRRQLPTGKWVELRGVPMPNGTYLGLYRDVTAEVVYEVELQEANRAKSDFLATMSHELRTPLNAIIGFADLMRAEIFGPLGDPRYHAYAGDIRDSGQHLLELINDILDYSKAEAGRMELSEEAVDLGALIQSSMRMLDTRAKRVGIALIADIDPRIHSIHADERRLKQIALNLLSNAIKFAPTSDGQVEIWATLNTAGELVLRISDNGIGISAHDLPRVIEPFRQAGNAISRNQEGTGLGLPLTKRLVEMHGGTLTLYSAVGIGTIATAKFPASRLTLKSIAETGRLKPGQPLVRRGTANR
ncbi:MAG TPA: ATP-binding protein [Stellaceae bacterium]|nr:ATP-binding protein [Stellaceae bacterium]